MSSDYLKNVKVLIVDDDSAIREVIVACLEQRGAEVTEADCVEKALACVHQNKPSIIVTDIMMPESDGFALIREVRSLSAEEGGQIPAIAITGAVTANIRLKYLTSGFQAYITKPFEPEELAIVISKWVEH